MSLQGHPGVPSLSKADDGTAQPIHLSDLPEGPTLHILGLVSERQKPSLRLVCKRFRQLVDGALCASLTVDDASHLGGRLSCLPIYGTQLDFTTAAADVLRQRAECLRCLVLDFAAYGCVFAARLLEQQPLPRLQQVELRNAEAQHVVALRALPELREVRLVRHVNGPVTAGPAAELLVAQLRGAPLASLTVSGYRMLAGMLGSIAEALSRLRQLSLAVETVEGPSEQLELAGLARLAHLRTLELRLLNSRPSAAGVCVAPLPPGASSLSRLSRIHLENVRAAEGEEEAFWCSLALLPNLQELRFAPPGHCAGGLPPALLQLSTLKALHIQVDSAYFASAADRSWAQLPELQVGALPQLTRLQLDWMGLAGLPPSWCRLPLRELYIRRLATECSSGSLQVPDELAALAPTVRRLELPCCGLSTLPEQVACLTGLTFLGLAFNSLARLPSLSQLQRLEEVQVYGNPATNIAAALQSCRSLRRLGLGSGRHLCRCLSAGECSKPPACEHVDACQWQEAWLAAVRRALPWVSEVQAGCEEQQPWPAW